MEELRFKLASFLKEVIWTFQFHRPGTLDDIALFSTRRGGSTWLMEIIGAEKGIRYVNQPFSLFRATARHRSLLPEMPDSQFISLRDDQRERVFDFIDSIRSGSLSINSPWEFWTPEFDFISSRLMFKILDAKSLIEDIGALPGMSVIFHTRHPIPVALSCINNGWSLTADAYLNDELFVGKYLSSEQTGFLRDCLRTGTDLEKFVANWVLENLAPLRNLENHPEWLFITHEEMICYPEESLSLLADRLDLECTGRMRSIMGISSRSTRKLVSSTTRQVDKLSGWKNHVSPENEIRIMNILKVCNIDLYEAGSVLPTRWRYEDDAKS